MNDPLILYTLEQNDIPVIIQIIHNWPTFACGHCWNQVCIGRCKLPGVPGLLSSQCLYFLTEKHTNNPYSPLQNNHRSFCAGSRTFGHCGRLIPGDWSPDDWSPVIDHRAFDYNRTPSKCVEATLIKRDPVIKRPVIKRYLKCWSIVLWSVIRDQTSANQRSAYLLCYV